MLKPSEKITDGSDGFDKDVTKKSPMYFSRKDDDIVIFCCDMIAAKAAI